MNDSNVEAMREAVRRGANRIYTDAELFEAMVTYGRCQTCGAARTSRMTEPEPGTFQMDMICTANPEHDCS